MPTNSVDFTYGGTSSYTPTVGETSYNAQVGGRPPVQPGGVARSIASTAGSIAGSMAPSGCSNVGIIQSANAFLDWGNGTGRTIVSVAAGLATEDPLVAFGVSAGIAAFQNATEGGCGVPTAVSPPATAGNVTAATSGIAGDVTSIAAAVDAGFTEVESELASLGDDVTRTRRIIQQLVQQTVVPMGVNPLFVVNPSFDTSQEFIWAQFGPEFQVQLRAAVPGTRNEGESLHDWLNRLVPGINWDWGYTVGESTDYIAAGLWQTEVGVPGPERIWYVGDVLTTQAWMRDFWEHYQYTPTSGPPKRSVMGDLIDFFALIPIYPGTT